MMHRSMSVHAMPSLRARLTNAFLRLTTKSVWKPGLDIQRLRRLTARMDGRIGRSNRPVATEEVEIAGVSATWIGEPALAARGTLLYLHGGAWCVHLPAIYRRMATELSAQTGMRVLLVDYRLAPEHPFPAAIDDCLAVYHWLIENGHAQRPFAIAGDSAGGNLTLVTLMRARDGGLPLPNCGVLISPAMDLTFSGPSVQYNAEADVMFSAGAGDLLPDVYCPGHMRTNPLISPLFGDWTGLPPLLFHAGSTEMLLDDSVRAHDRARQAGTAADITVWLDLPHVFHAIRWLPESRQGLRAVADFILMRSVDPGPTLVAQQPEATVAAVTDVTSDRGVAL
jgi:monoterpene epsilon-lactone hydrolase